MKKALLVLGLISTGQYAHAARAVMEGIVATNYAVYIDSVNARIDNSTNSYNGTVPTVGIFTTSNVVVSNTNGDNCVIYASGTIACKTFSGSAAGLSGIPLLTSTQTWSGMNTFLSTTTVGMTTQSSTVTLNLGILKNVYQLVVSSQNTSSGAASMRYTGLAQGNCYRAVVRSTTSVTSVYIFARFNDDSTTGNYKYAQTGTNAGGTSFAQGDGGVNPGGCAMTNNSGTVKIGEPFYIIFTFCSPTGSEDPAKMVMGTYSSYSTNSGATNAETTTGACEYRNGPPSTISFHASNGSLARGWGYIQLLNSQ